MSAKFGTADTRMHVVMYVTDGVFEITDTEGYISQSKTPILEKV